MGLKSDLQLFEPLNEKTLICEQKNCKKYFNIDRPKLQSEPFYFAKDQLLLPLRGCQKPYVFSKVRNGFLSDENLNIKTINYFF